ncbi:hypothetical protein FSARC_13097 [Fusarium sarcochroum]|uniref:Uncharacterized protein n=1 Tax=Fusarium sarcochroum TaxID=1208366 RepID=A0A8H4T3X5_9HYPO|nr:hypothetical protein FSARC_13097 [Fusarium sarcochroum]
MASHKLTPVLMTGSLLLALLLAIGHHFYYQYLDGNIVESQSQQEWFLRVGTGMAFLARALLSAAVGFAYTQILWRTLRSKSVSIQGVNSLFGILHDAWDFTTWELWTAAPALAVVAMIAWALPLIAVVTPATLTVQVSSYPNKTVIDSPLPILDYSDPLNFAQWTAAGGTGYLAPSSYISRVLLSVASSGSILAIPAPSPNSSYSLDFYGPTISCGAPKNATFAKLVTDTVKNSTWSANPVGYVGFVPQSRLGGDISLDLADDVPNAEEYALLGLEGALNTSLISTMATLDKTGRNTSTAKFYVVVPDSPSSTGYMVANKSIECALYNSSFAVDFTYNNGQQDISYKTKKLNGVSAANTLTCGNQSPDSCKDLIAYISLMDALGKLLLGSLQISHYGAMSPTQTQIMSSALMDSKEMQALRAVNSVDASEREEILQSVIGNISISDALEQLFTNATISLFSNSRFLQNDTAASNGPITYLSPQIAFSYAPRNLFIAYGSGLLVAAIVVAFGLVCIKSSSASYGNSFSTILRTTRNPDLDTMVPAAETSGAEPLSNHLGNSRLVLRSQGRRLGGMEEDTVTFFAVDSTPDEMKRTERQSPDDSWL